MLEIENYTNIKFTDTKLQEISCFLSKKNIELILCDDEYIKEINTKFRNKNETTDVLSFPYEDIEHTPLGSVIINLNLAQKISKKLNHSLEDELSLLLIHAILHLLGYDHEVDQGEMYEREKKLMLDFDLPKSLIDRSNL